MIQKREDWVRMLKEIADPVLKNAAEGKLHARMPVEQRPGAGREVFTHLEAVGRLLCGMAPWLETPDPETRRREDIDAYAELARRAVEQITDSASPDACPFEWKVGEPGQPLVDAAFLAHAFLRAPGELWERLSPAVKVNVVSALKSSRCIRPLRTNWLLFSAMVEAALYHMTGECDAMRVDYALTSFRYWYKGDGVYGDGDYFHWDYYNSYVIQPMLVDISRETAPLFPENGGLGEELRDTFIGRASRYAQVLERLIGPDGTYPVLGRSSAYRCGAFQMLAQAALQHILPENLPANQVRCALSAVISRTMEAPGTFDKEGWLTIGVCGSQPGLGERYISTGSLYLCAAAFLPLGLPETDAFWRGEDVPYTAQKIWSGEDMPLDHAAD